MATDFPFPKNQHVVITGASSGLGEALAMEMAQRGAHVTLMARRQAVLDAVARRAGSLGGDTLAVAADVTDQSSVEFALAQAVEQFGPVDILIANAGISPNMSALEIDVPLITSAMQLNFFGVVYPVHAVLPSMLERGTGAVVAVSSVAAFRGLPTMSPYCASKSAVSAWMESLRSELDLKETGVRMITCHPGYIRTPMTEAEATNMPLLVEVEDAARIVVDGISSGQSRIDFPRPLVAGLKFAGSLPDRLYDRVIWGSATNPVTWGIAAKDAVMWLLGFAIIVLLSRSMTSDSSGSLPTVLRVALPLLFVVMLVVSKRLRKSIKIPILILLLSLPLMLLDAIVRWMT